MLLTSNGSCAEGVEWPTPCSCTRRRQAAAAGRQQHCSCSCRSLVLLTSAVKCRCGQSLALRTPVLSAGVCRGAINNLSPQTLHSVAGTINMSVIARWTSVCGCSTQHPQRTGPKINTSTILGFHFFFSPVMLWRWTALFTAIIMPLLGLQSELRKWILKCY